MLTIFAVSDSIGETAEQVAEAAASQFSENVEVRRIPYVKSLEDVQELINDINSSMLSSSQIDRISTLFKVLGDSTRAKIVLALDNREVCVCTLANALGMTKSAVSHQLAILKVNNIVKSRRDGKQVYYSFDDEHITDIIEIAQAHIKHQND